jgi:hypothetical protein
MTNEAEPTLDLDRLVKRLVSEDGVETPELARLAIEEYKKFFILCTFAQDARDIHVPSTMVDMVWQRHQLDTANYIEDCSYFCLPGGYMHRHYVATNQDEPSGECKAGDQYPAYTVSDAYEKTLRRYEDTFGVAPDPAIWPKKAFDTKICSEPVGVAIPLLEIASFAVTAASTATEEQLVSELMWVGEVVRAELPKKQARCPSTDEPINQIRFYTHCDCFVPSAEQEQQRLEVVVREYVRFLMLVLKHHYTEPVALEVSHEEGLGSELLETGATPGEAAAQNELEDYPAATNRVRTTQVHFQVTPSKLVDELWHAHILRSPAYFQFCLQHAPGGRYVHHEPHFDKPHNYHEPGFAETVKAYAAQFGCPPRDVWGVLGESGGACGGGGGGFGGGSFGGGSAGLGVGTSSTYRSLTTYNSTVSCGACSATNGNRGSNYVVLSAAAKRHPVTNSTKMIEHSNLLWSPVWDMFYKHNHIVNRGSMFVVARTNLRVYAKLLAEYGRAPPYRERTLVLFMRRPGRESPYLIDGLGVGEILYNHILRQIYLHEQAMLGAATALSNLRWAPNQNNDARATRQALYAEWWARNSSSNELLYDMNELLAPFNVQMEKIVESDKGRLYDHYIFRPRDRTWGPASAHLPPDVSADYRAQWGRLRQRMKLRKGELRMQRSKSPDQWQTEVTALADAWLTQSNIELKAYQATTYLPKPDHLVQDKCDIAFAALIDSQPLIHANALSDRVYLRKPYLDIDPSIRPPWHALPAHLLEGAVSPDSQPAAPTASAVTPTNPVPFQTELPEAVPVPEPASEAPARTVQFSVTVPAGVSSGDNVRFYTPQGREMVCVVPPNVQPGMQFLVSVLE